MQLNTHLRVAGWTLLWVKRTASQLERSEIRGLELPTRIYQTSLNDFTALIKPDLASREESVWVSPLAAGSRRLMGGRLRFRVLWAAVRSLNCVFLWPMESR